MQMISIRAMEVTGATGSQKLAAFQRGWADWVGQHCLDALKISGGNRCAFRAAFRRIRSLRGCLRLLYVVASKDHHGFDRVPLPTLIDAIYDKHDAAQTKEAFAKSFRRSYQSFSDLRILDIDKDKGPWFIRVREDRLADIHGFLDQHPHLEELTGDWRRIVKRIKEVSGNKFSNDDYSKLIDEKSLEAFVLIYGTLSSLTTGRIVTRSSLVNKMISNQGLGIERQICNFKLGINPPVLRLEDKVKARRPATGALKNALECFKRFDLIEYDAPDQGATGHAAHSVRIYTTPAGEDAWAWLDDNENQEGQTKCVLL